MGQVGHKASRTVILEDGMPGRGKGGAVVLLVLRL